MRNITALPDGFIGPAYRNTDLFPTMQFDDGGVSSTPFRTYMLPRWTVFFNFAGNTSTVVLQHYDEDGATLLRSLSLSAAVATGQNHLLVRSSDLSYLAAPFCGFNFTRNTAGVCTFSYILLFGGPM